MLTKTDTICDEDVQIGFIPHCHVPVVKPAFGVRLELNCSSSAYTHTHTGTHTHTHTQTHTHIHTHTHNELELEVKIEKTREIVTDLVRSYTLNS